MKASQASDVPKTGGDDNPTTRTETRKRRRKGERKNPVRPGTNTHEGPSEPEEKEEKAAFQFLNISDPYLPPDRTHRKAVRTHVMRNFHSQRRKDKSIPKKKYKLRRKGGEDKFAEEEISNSSPTESSVPGTVTPADSSKREDDSLNTEGLTQEEAQLTHQIDGLSVRTTDSPEVDTAAATENSEATTLSSPEHQLLVPALADADLSQFDRWLFNTTSPYALLQGDGAPYLEIDARKWPFPQALGGTHPKTSVWMPSVYEPPPNLRHRACLHKSSQVLPYIQNSSEFFEFKGKTIRWINERLEDAVLGLSDETMGSIMVLISFELEASRGNVAECVKHMDGIERIVKLRGGIDTWKDKRCIQLKILLLDMIVSVLSNNLPRFPILRTTHPAPLYHGRPHPDTDRTYDSPLHSTAPFSTTLAHTPFRKETIQILQRMRDLTVFVTRGLNIAIDPLESLSITSPSSPIQLETERTFHTHAQITSHTSTIYPTPPTLHHIIALTSSLYIRALSSPPTPFSSPSNRHTVLELISAIESPAHDDIWDEFPGIFVWVLLTAASAARDLPQHGLLVSLLTRIGLGAGYGWWEGFSRGVRAFGGVKRRAEGR